LPYLQTKDSRGVVSDPVTYERKIKNYPTYEFTCIPSSKSDEEVTEKFIKELNTKSGSEVNQDLFNSVFYFILKNLKEN
jgi:hypothetical protein